MKREAISSAAELVPLALEYAPALIETVFPSQKVSFEAQRERKAGAGQTLTPMGSYWKGRKPLILVRAIILGTLLPPTKDPEADLDVFERLMAFDEEGLARRALTKNDLRPRDIAARIKLKNPWRYFTHGAKRDQPQFSEISKWSFPIDCGDAGINIRWRRDATRDDKLILYRKALGTFASYEDKAGLCKRPEELDPVWLYEPVWPAVNRHYAHLGIEVWSFEDLVEQMGLLRYGHRPLVGDAFCGGGSIPFEAARLGCDVYASDLNPIASMLTWGALNIVGASTERRAKIEEAQREVAGAVDQEITALGIEHDEHGNRAKVYLYCLETRCPESGWKVPMLPSLIISKQRNVVAELAPNQKERRFDIQVRSGVSADEMEQARLGTIRDQALSYRLNGKNYHTPIKTLRGDYRDSGGATRNRLRLWEKHDFMPRPDDVYQERLYAIQWIAESSLTKKRQETFFAAVTDADLERERIVEDVVEENLASWQEGGIAPDMEIEPGYNTDQPIRERGWTHWHHLFNPRQLLLACLYKKNAAVVGDAELRAAVLAVQSKALDWNTRLCSWATSARHENQAHTFANQALNTLYNYGVRALRNLENHSITEFRDTELHITAEAAVASLPADQTEIQCDVFITDPPYADAVQYHEITEFFIAWLRKAPPSPFDQWTWDSRRALAIKGTGDAFRRGMVDSYRAMTAHMPENGMQCVMFTHQDIGVWADMVGIFWATGLQVVAAWYIATETTSEFKKGGYVQGTVILMLRRREAGDRPGFKQRILPVVRTEVGRQIEAMMHLNEGVQARLGEPVFNDSDLQMAGYAAALKVLTSYTSVGGEDVTTLALRPRSAGTVTVVDEMVQQAREAANNLLVPDGLSPETWAALSGIQRFYLRMMDMETTGASKLDNYQNFAKTFRVEDYTQVMGSMTPNRARLKTVTEFASRGLTDSTEIGPTPLGQIIIGLQQLLREVEPQAVVSQLQAEMPNFIEVRPALIAMLRFMEGKSPESRVRDAAEVLSARLRNIRALGQ